MTGIFLRIPAAEHALGHAGFDARNQTSSSYDRIWTKRLGRAQRLSSDDTKTGVPGTAYGPASQTCCPLSTVALSLSSISIGGAQFTSEGKSVALGGRNLTKPTLSAPITACPLEAAVPRAQTTQPPDEAFGGR